MLKHKSIAQIRAQIKQWRSNGASLGLVPTMGNLHRGHLHLVEVAQQNADRVVVSIFVNPLQFTPGTDFEMYPRTLTQDMDKLAEYGVDAVFIPEVGAIYTNELQVATKVVVPELSGLLCGQFRAGHFEGVTTVVAKLFNIIQPDIALFGEKDFQQLVVIKRMVADLNFPVDILGVETVREPGGLAMSSRNQYLTQEQRRNATMLYQVLQEIAQHVKQMESNETLSQAAMRDMEQQAHKQLNEAGFKPEYVQICDAETLSPATAETKLRRVLAAVWLGKARLIDNLAI